MALMAESFSSKLCYTVFHIDRPARSKDDHIRNFCVNNINKFVSVDKFNTPTISIKTLDNVKEFLVNNPRFIIDPKGHDPFYKRSEQYYSREDAQPLGWQYSTIGIWASSYTAYKNFLSSDYEYLLVFEDDLLIDSTFMGLLSTYFEELPDTWDIYYHFNPGSSLKFTEEISEHLCKSSQMWSNACYVISRQGAEKAVKSAEEEPGVYLPIDWHFLKQLDKFDIYTVKLNRKMGCRLANVESTYFKVEEQLDLTGLL